MAKLVRCDKCGSVRKPEDARTVQVTIGAQYAQPFYKKDLCIDCTHNFLDNFKEYFGE